MLYNVNYVFWGARGLPLTVILVSVLLVIFFFFATEAFFGRWKTEQQTTHSLVVITSLFITMLGLALILVSLPLSQRAIQVHNNIMYYCKSSEATRELNRYYMSIAMLRQEPSCANKYSVEECSNYVAVEPYSKYLKDMEQQFRCSGFCYEQPASALQQKTSNISTKNQTAFVVSHDAKSVRSFSAIQVRSRSTPSEGTKARSAGSGSQLQRSASKDTLAYPPTLYSDANFQSSCDGAAARNMMNFARDSGYQMWYIGITLIALSIIMGLWEWSALVSK